MPELPEVETVKRGLAQSLKDQPRLLEFQFFRKDLRDPMPTKKLQSLKGERLLQVRRRAKYLIFETETGGFLSHLGMTGIWKARRGIAPKSKPLAHEHVRIFFSDGLSLTYHDPRRFGVLDILSPATIAKRLQHLGPEPLDEAFTGTRLWHSLRGKQVAIKAAIMDQKIVVGVGNIYASEALFAAGVRPQSRAGSLSKVRAEALTGEIKKVLEKAIEAGGSTISDFQNSSSESGYFQTQFKVYGREGEKCLLCATPLRVAVIGGRSSFWCPHCQS